MAYYEYACEICGAAYQSGSHAIGFRKISGFCRIHESNTDFVNLAKKVASLYSGSIYSIAMYCMYGRGTSKQNAAIERLGKALGKGDLIELGLAELQVTKADLR